MTDSERFQLEMQLLSRIEILDGEEWSLSKSIDDRIDANQSGTAPSTKIADLPVSKNLP
jgi:hypothetical protein